MTSSASPKTHQMRQAYQLLAVHIDSKFMNIGKVNDGITTVSLTRAGIHKACCKLASTTIDSLLAKMVSERRFTSWRKRGSDWVLTSTAIFCP